MSDLTGSPPEGGPNLPEYSVSELSFALKRTVEDNFGYVRVRGEISGLMRARSGHMYLSMKDDKSVLDAVVWKGTAGRLRFQPEDGLEVICTGKLTTYPARSRYQLVVESMEPAGVGALMALLEERRRKLTAEGLFAEERKRRLPYLPQVVGVVTSPTGAVIRDILHRLRDRFPRHVLLWPVLVQGDAAAGQIAAAIRGFNAIQPGGPVPRPDVLIVARGGGSIEDLWAFNEEIVVRAAAESEIPLISAVGHETDTTLIDFASDRRAPTPTAAAEIAVPVRGELLATVADLGRRHGLAQSRLLQERRRMLESLSRGLKGPRELLALSQQRLDDTGGRLALGLRAIAQAKHRELSEVAAGLRPTLIRREVVRLHERLQAQGERALRAQRQRLETQRQRLATQAMLLQTLSFERVLERGYAVVRGEAGGVITRAAETAGGMGVRIQFHDDAVAAVIGGSGSRGVGGGGGGGAVAAARPRPKTRRGKESDDQGDLF